MNFGVGATAVKGDREGHPFHGNQWIDGGGIDHIAVGREIGRKWAKMVNEQEAWLPDAAYYYGFRIHNESPDKQNEDFAMLSRVVGASNEKDAMECLSGYSAWHTGGTYKSLEWAAAKAMNPECLIPKDETTLPEVSKSMLAAYKERQKCVKEAFEKRYGDSAEMYRGVYGRPATAVAVAGGSKGDEVDFMVRGLSSWTPHSSEADGFATKWGRNKNYALVVSKTIKALDAWLVTGFGPIDPQTFADDANEVVQVTGDRIQKAKIFSLKGGRA